MEWVIVYAVAAKRIKGEGERWKSPLWWRKFGEIHLDVTPTCIREPLLETSEVVHCKDPLKDHSQSDSLSVSLVEWPFSYLQSVTHKLIAAETPLTRANRSGSGSVCSPFVKSTWPHSPAIQKVTKVTQDNECSGKSTCRHLAPLFPSDLKLHQGNNGLFCTGYGWKWKLLHVSAVLTPRL